MKAGVNFGYTGVGYSDGIHDDILKKHPIFFSCVEEEPRQLATNEKEVGMVELAATASLGPVPFLRPDRAMFASPSNTDCLFSSALRQRQSARRFSRAIERLLLRQLHLFF